MSNNNMMKKIILHLLNLGSTFFLTYIIHVSAKTSRLQDVFLFAYFFVLNLLINILCKRKSDSGEIRKRVNFICGIVVILLAIFFSKNSRYLQKNEFSELRISALAVNNPDSQGMEVWFSKVLVDGRTISENSIDISNGWYYKEGSYYTNASEQPYNNCIVRLPRGEKIDIVFAKHEWSGIAEIQYEGETEQVDLYANPAGTLTFSQERKFVPLSIEFRSIIVLGYLCMLIVLCRMVLSVLSLTGWKRYIKNGV